MPAVPSCIINPLRDQFSALILERVETHPLRCHRRQIPDRVIFDKLIQVVVLGINYNKIADSSCSTTTLRTRRDEWIRLGILTPLEAIARDGYDKMVGLDLEHFLIDGCIVKAPCRG